MAENKKTNTKEAEVKKDAPAEVKVVAPKSRLKVTSGLMFVHATFNNTKISFADHKGNVFLASSSGAMGFKGAKKGTPFAAAKVAEVLADKAKLMGLSDVDVVVKGVGSGRESSIRAVSGKGITVNSIVDKTPIPHNGPRPRKPRRV